MGRVTNWPLKDSTIFSGGPQFENGNIYHEVFHGEQLFMQKEMFNNLWNQ